MGFFPKIDDLKTYFGKGAMADEEELTKMVTQPKQSGFDGMMTHTLSNILRELILPWLDHCLGAYKEPEFHKIMASGFDLYKDWQDNHYNRYWRMVKMARRVRRWIALDQQEVAQWSVARLQKNGWYVYESEYLAILKALQHVKDDIFI